MVQAESAAASGAEGTGREVGERAESSNGARLAKAVDGCILITERLDDEAVEAPSTRMQKWDGMLVAVRTDRWCLGAALSPNSFFE